MKNGRIGFIGAGNMATAIVAGLVASGTYKPENIMMFDLDAGKLKENAEKYRISPADCNSDMIAQCDVIVLAVKPIALPSLLTELAEAFGEYKPLVISIAAGQSIARLKSFIGEDIHVVRVMPNINATANEAMSGYAGCPNVTDAELKTACDILDSFGKCVEVDEDLFAVYSAIAGCAPAYAYLFIDAVARVGVKYGLTKKDSLKIVAKSVANSSFSQDRSSLCENDREIIETSFDIADFDGIVNDCIVAALEKDKRM